MSDAPFNLHGIRAAIIDLDGTMVDTLDDFTAALAGMLDTLGLPGITREEVSHYIGKGSEHLVRMVLRQRAPQSTEGAAFEHALEVYQGHYGRINGRFTKLYPGVLDGVSALHENGIRLACVTNKPERFARELLAHYALLPMFQVVFGGDSLPLKKPDPLPMRRACEALGVSAQQTVAIGDSENDTRAAHAAGLASLAVPYGYNHGQPVQSIGADAIVATLLDAARLIISSDTHLNPSCS